MATQPHARPNCDSTESGLVIEGTPLLVLHVLLCLYSRRASLGRVFEPIPRHRVAVQYECDIVVYKYGRTHRRWRCERCVRRISRVRFDTRLLPSRTSNNRSCSRDTALCISIRPPDCSGTQAPDRSGQCGIVNGSNDRDCCRRRCRSRRCGASQLAPNEMCG